MTPNPPKHSRLAITFTATACQKSVIGETSFGLARASEGVSTRLAAVADTATRATHLATHNACVLSTASQHLQQLLHSIVLGHGEVAYGFGDTDHKHK